MCVHVCVFPSTQAKCDTRSIFKQSLPSLNLVFSPRQVT